MNKQREHLFITAIIFSILLYIINLITNECKRLKTNKIRKQKNEEIKKILNKPLGDIFDGAEFTNKDTKLIDIPNKDIHRIMYNCLSNSGDLQTLDIYRNGDNMFGI